MKKYSEMYYEERQIDLLRTYEYAFTYMMKNLADYVPTDDENVVKDYIESQVNIFIENDPMFLDEERKEMYDDMEKYNAELVDFLMAKYKDFYTNQED